MEHISPARFFLGANTPGGFYSLYDSFTDPERDHLYILKGGPGCGKSTFMKAVGAAAESAGLFVEYIHCSGDPDSLDGVYIPSLGAAYVDGTSPHVIEPKFAGSQASYVNMGAFYDLAELGARREEIARLTALYKSHYARAFRCLTGAASLTGPALPEDAVAAVSKRARGLIRRELRGGGEGRVTARFLSGFTCLGPMALFGTVPALAERVYLLDNDLGLAHVVLDAAAREAALRSIDTISCRSPLRPELTEHLIFPGIGLALVTQTSLLPYTGPVTRHMRLDAAPDRAALVGLRPEARRAARLRRALIAEATSALADAKSAHDELEAQYIPAVDFAGIDRLTARHIEALLT